MTEAEKEAREALAEKVAKALEDDGWLGHPDELVPADLRMIAEVAVVVFEQASRAPQPTDDERVTDDCGMDHYTNTDSDPRVEVVETGFPPVQLIACVLCGVILWDIDAHYAHAHESPDQDQPDRSIR